MKAFLEKLESNFNSELQTILETHKNNTRSALDLSRKYLIDLKNEIINRGFRNSQDEINCFKVTKPKLHAELIYFRGVLIAQQNLPLGSDKIKKNYLNDHLARFHVFFEENKEFIRYSRSESTYMDDHFFIRENARAYENDGVDFAEVDFRWNTGYDLILAKCLAFEKLEHQIRNELFRISHMEETILNPIVPQTNPKKILKWTESKTALVELIYALHSVGALNNGQVDLKTITEVLQNTLQIELGDHYKIYHDLKARKIARTKFLNNLIETLNRRMEADDE
ncbi:RteC domain-containing protein [Fluviicola sp.]|uniref:RteC domain-containing protein n=1 Tax=Fluviicola sp. TaxID=1917219 RepID=UPI0026399711|nr:RteC domain-containing protein [Fluviicola sp.]